MGFFRSGNWLDWVVFEVCGFFCDVLWFNVGCVLMGILLFWLVLGENPTGSGIGRNSGEEHA